MNTQTQSSTTRAASRGVTHQRTTPVHTSLAGRARFEVRGLKRNPSLKNFIEMKLRPRVQEQVAGLGVEARANVVTGTVLVEFPKKTSWRAVQEQLDQAIDQYSAASADERRAFAAKIPSGSLANAVASPLMPDPEFQWHSLNESEVVAQLGATLDGGLSSELAYNRQRDVGLNALTIARRRTESEILRDQFNSLPVGLLLGSAGLSVLTGGAVEAVVILAVVATNAYIGYKTESLAEKTINLLTSLGPAHVLAIRDGEAQKILSEELVPGDVFLVTTGLAVPADARLLKTEALTVDESPLTGENLPVQKRIGKLGEKTVVSDRFNMLYRGTLITAGSGIAIVTATGDRTELGKIQSFVQNTEQLSTPIQLQLESLTHDLIKLSAGLGAGIFVVGLLRGYSFIEMLKMSLTLAVAAVPEGLPTVATISLTQSASKMKDRKVLVRTLGAVEALGSTQVICLDKTGTLTMNHMTVRQLIVGMDHVDARGDSYLREDGSAVTVDSDPVFRELIEVSVLCNEALVRHDEAGEPSFKGSPTEIALLEMSLRSGLAVNDLRFANPVRKVTHRTEEISYMLTEHRGRDQKTFTAIKGNPEEVLSLCGYYFDKGKRRKLTPAISQRIIALNDALGDEALRVLGIASKRGSTTTWLGMVGMADQPREGIRELLRSFHAAGIKTVMITGDQSATALAVGRELGISGDAPLKIFDWSDVAKVDPQELVQISRETHIFARVSPSEKLRIVKALQEAGNVVAMVGDGINDAPALKAADVGVAMGLKGTEVAREVADVVIMDDRLQSLLPGIALGRTTYDSIQKSVVYLITTNLSESLLMFLSMGVGLGQPLNSMQILWINLISDLFPAMALALEMPESEVLKRPPQEPFRPILQSEDIKKVAVEASVMSVTSLLSYGVGYGRYGCNQKSQTMAFTSLAVAQLLHTLSSRSDEHGAFDEHVKSNRYVSLAVGAGLSLQSLPLLIPALRSLLHVSPLGLADLGVSLGGSVLNLLYNESQVRRLKTNKMNLAINTQNQLG